MTPFIKSCAVCVLCQTSCHECQRVCSSTDQGVCVACFSLQKVIAGGGAGDLRVEYVDDARATLPQQ